MHQTYRLLAGIGRKLSALIVVLCFFMAGEMASTAENAAFAQTNHGSLPFKLVPQTKLRVSVVEWLAAEGEYKEWTAVGGEFTVGTEGTISVPLVGVINALGSTTSEIADAISTALQANTGLAVAPAVSAEIVTYPAVFVTGDVENPGEIEYRPGLTVMQAIALAGGQQRAPDTTNRWDKIDQIRHSGELNRVELQIVQQIARKSRLQAELEGKPEISFAPEFELLLNEPITRQIKTTESILFQARNEAFERQMASLDDLRELLIEEITVLEDKMAVQDRQIEVATEELRSVSKLFDSGVVTKSRQTDLGRLVADLQRTKMDMIIASMRAQQKKSETSRDIVTMRADRQIELSRELQDSVSMLEELSMRRATSRQLLLATGVLSLENEQRASLAKIPLDFSVLRASQTRLTTDISSTDLLFPGDLLEVRLSLEVPLDTVASSKTIESQ